jgi:hypothetical protein
MSINYVYNTTNNNNANNESGRLSSNSTYSLINYSSDNKKRLEPQSSRLRIKFTPPSLSTQPRRSVLKNGSNSISNSKSRNKLKSVLFKTQPYRSLFNDLSTVYEEDDLWANEIFRELISPSPTPSPSPPQYLLNSVRLDITPPSIGQSISNYSYTSYNKNNTNDKPKSQSSRPTSTTIKVDYLTTNQNPTAQKLSSSSKVQFSNNYTPSSSSSSKSPKTSASSLIKSTNSQNPLITSSYQLTNPKPKQEFSSNNSSSDQSYKPTSYYTNYANNRSAIDYSQYLYSDSVTEKYEKLTNQSKTSSKNSSSSSTSGNSTTSKRSNSVDKQKSSNSNISSVAPAAVPNTIQTPRQSRSSSVQVSSRSTNQRDKEKIIRTELNNILNHTQSDAAATTVLPSRQSRADTRHNSKAINTISSSSTKQLPVLNLNLSKNSNTSSTNPVSKYTQSLIKPTGPVIKPQSTTTTSTSRSTSITEKISTTKTNSAANKTSSTSSTPSTRDSSVVKPKIKVIAKDVLPPKPLTTSSSNLNINSGGSKTKSSSTVNRSGSTSHSRRSSRDPPPKRDTSVTLSAINNLEESKQYMPTTRTILAGTYTATAGPQRLSVPVYDKNTNTIIFLPKTSSSNTSSLTESGTKSKKTLSSTSSSSSTALSPILDTVKQQNSSPMLKALASPSTSSTKSNRQTTDSPIKILPVKISNSHSQSPTLSQVSQASSSKSNNNSFISNSDQNSSISSSPAPSVLINEISSYYKVEPRSRWNLEDYLYKPSDPNFSLKKSTTSTDLLPVSQSSLNLSSKNSNYVSLPISKSASTSNATSSLSSTTPDILTLKSINNNSNLKETYRALQPPQIASNLSSAIGKTFSSIEKSSSIKPIIVNKPVSNSNSSSSSSNLKSVSSKIPNPPSPVTQLPIENKYEPIETVYQQYKKSISDKHLTNSAGQQQIGQPNSYAKSPSIALATNSTLLPENLIVKPDKTDLDDLLDYYEYFFKMNKMLSNNNSTNTPKLNKTSKSSSSKKESTKTPTQPKPLSNPSMSSLDSLSSNNSSSTYSHPIKITSSANPSQSFSKSESNSSLSINNRDKNVSSSSSSSRKNNGKSKVIEIPVQVINSNRQDDNFFNTSIQPLTSETNNPSPVLESMSPLSSLSNIKSLLNMSVTPSSSPYQMPFASISPPTLSIEETQEAAIKQQSDEQMNKSEQSLSFSINPHNNNVRVNDFYYEEDSKYADSPSFQNSDEFDTNKSNNQMLHQQQQLLQPLTSSLVHSSSNPKLSSFARKSEPIAEETEIEDNTYDEDEQDDYEDSD